MYIELLNKLILVRPTSTLGGKLAPLVSAEVSETLSVGMEVLHGAALARIKILSELVSGALKTGTKTSAQHILLMTKYFSSQSRAQNVVAIVPTLSALKSLETEEVDGAKRKLRPHIVEMANLLDRVLTLVRWLNFDGVRSSLFVVCAQNMDDAREQVAQRLAKADTLSAAEHKKEDELRAQVRPNDSLCHSVLCASLDSLSACRAPRCASSWPAPPFPSLAAPAPARRPMSLPCRCVAADRHIDLVLALTLVPLFVLAARSARD